MKRLDNREYSTIGTMSNDDFKDIKKKSLKETSTSNDPKAREMNIIIKNSDSIEGDVHNVSLVVESCIDAHTLEKNNEEEIKIEDNNENIKENSKIANENSEYLKTNYEVIKKSNESIKDIEFSNSEKPEQISNS